jgi:hypothetical protein
MEDASKIYRRNGWINLLAILGVPCTSAPLRETVLQVLRPRWDKWFVD